MIWVYFQAFKNLHPPRSGIYEKKFEKRLKKSVSFRKINSAPIPIPKPGFGHTLLLSKAVSLAELQVPIPKIS